MFTRRIHVLLPHLQLGGGETATLDLAEALARRSNLHVGALALQEAPTGPNIRSELVSRFKSVTFFEFRWQLRPWLQRAESVIWYGINPAVPRTLQRLDPRPISIRWVHTERPEDGPAFDRRFRRAIDATVCVSPAVARRIPGAIFMANGCTDRFLQGTRRKLFDNDRPTLGFLGRLVPLKNVPWLIENLRELSCNLALQVIDSELQTVDDLRRLVHDLDLDSRVCFLPAERDVGTLLRSVDALALVSKHEGFPRVVIEAARLAVPVIATPVGALPEIFPREILFLDLQHGFPTRSSFLQALERLSPVWGEKLRTRAADLCDPERIAEQVLELVEQPAPTQRPRACAAS